MFEVEVAPAVVFALDAASDDVRRRFFVVADYLKGRPSPSSAPSAFWGQGEHFDIVRPPIILGGIFMENLRVIYQAAERVRDGSNGDRNVIRIYAFSEGSNPVAGWEYAR